MHSIINIVQIDYDTRDYVAGTGETRINTAYVYLPYGYDEASDQPYNVFYFLHGHGETAASFFQNENDFYIWVASGSNDVAYDRILVQIQAMPQLTDVFPVTNLTFHEQEGVRHEFRPIAEYLYNAPYKNRKIQGLLYLKKSGLDKLRKAPIMEANNG